MHDPYLLVLSGSLVLLVLLVAWLITLLAKSQQLSLTTFQTLLSQQMLENQSLRNQLRAPDVATLAGLNHATSLSNNETADTQTLEQFDEGLGEAIDYEERLARSGYSLGDLDNGLESSGWARAVVKNGTDLPSAFDLT